MLKKIKSILLIIAALIIALVFLYAFSLSIRSTFDAKRIDKVLPIIKKELNLSVNDALRACVYDDDRNLIIFSVNHRDYFTINGSQIKIIDFINDETKKKYPNFSVDNEFADVYWVLENCR